MMLAAVSLASCIYDFDPVVVEDASRLVINGEITIGGISSFSTYYTQPLDNRKTLKSNGILLVESENGKTYGSNRSGSSFEIDTRDANPNVRYRIKYQEKTTGKTYLSTWQNVLPAPKVSDYTYTFDEDNVYTKITVDGGDDIQFFKWKYDETWEFHADYIPEWEFNPETGRVDSLERSDASLYYCWANTSSTDFGLASAEDHSSNVLKNQSLVVIPRRSQKLTSMYRVDVTCSALTKDAYNYFMNMRNISNMTGSLFTPSPDDMRGNIYNVNDSKEFVVGYITAVQKSVTRYYLDPRKDALYIPRKVEPLIDLFKPDLTHMSLFDFVREGNIPVIRVYPPDEASFIGWGDKSCADCRRKYNGYLEKPADWLM